MSHWFVGPDGAPVHVLDGIDLDVDAGEFVCLVGPSGCGKSTLLRVLAGLVRPSAGTVIVDGTPVDGPQPRCGVVFQQPSLYPWLPVIDNVAFGLRLRGVGRRERLETARDYLHLVGLEGVDGFRPYELSGGMQQRVQLARVLCTEPAVVLMDEPFGALDAITRERLQDELRRIWAETGMTVVFITHSVDEAVYLGTRVIGMSPRPGRLVGDIPVDLTTDATPGTDARHTAAFADLAASAAALLHAEPERPEETT